MMKSVIVLGAIVFCVAPTRAQSGSNYELVAGSREWQVWTAMGSSVVTTAHNAAVWNWGMRYGWVLTDLHGPAFLRGRFEYAVDATPVFAIIEPTQTVYGVSTDPLVLRWNFQQRGRIAPYVDLSAGVLFTNRQVPPGANRVNFTSCAGIGASVPRGPYRWSLEVRYLHISDASLTSYNPGINQLQLRVGLGWHKGPR